MNAKHAIPKVLMRCFAAVFCLVAAAATLLGTAYADDAYIAEGLGNGAKDLIQWNPTSSSETIAGQGMPEAATGNADPQLRALNDRQSAGVVPIPLDVSFRQSEARSMLSMINTLRAQNGVGQLSWDEELESAAMQRAAEITMLFDHTRPDGSDCFTAFPTGAGAVGENIAAGLSSANSTFNQWCASPGHYSNMVNSLYNSVGIACVYVGSGYGYYWVQCFGSSLGSGITSPAYDDAATVVVNVPDSFIDSYYYEDDPIYLGTGESQALSVVDVLIFGTFQDGQIVSGVLSFYSTFFDWSSSEPGVVLFSPNEDETVLSVKGATLGSTTLTGSTELTSKIKMSIPVQVVDAARLSGETRFQTMECVSGEGFESSEWAVVALGDNFPDSLSASAIAGALRCPILLTSGSSLSPEVSSEIDRLGANNIAVIGSESAVSKQIYEQISMLDGVQHIERIAGADRIKTSIEVARRAQEIDGSSDTLIIALASNFPDGISVSSYAWSTASPLVLCDTQGLTNDAKRYIANSRCSKAVIVGSEDVLPGSIADDVKSLGLTVKRVCGGQDGGNSYDNNRYGTSMAMVDFCLSEGLSLSGSVVVTGENFPDALAGGALAGSHGGCVVLVGNTDENIEPAFNCLKGSKASLIRILGSESAISEFAYNRIKQALTL